MRSVRRVVKIGFTIPERDEKTSNVKVTMNFALVERKYSDNIEKVTVELERTLKKQRMYSRIIIYF